MTMTRLTTPCSSPTTPPYIVKRYCDNGLQGRFELNDGYEKMWNEQYCIQHCKNNGHHVKGWDEKVNGKRFIFTKQQQEFIVNLLNAIEG